MGGGLQVNIVSVHILYVGFTLILRLFMLDGTVCQVLQFTSVYVSLRWWAETWTSTIGWNEKFMDGFREVLEISSIRLTKRGQRPKLTTEVT